MPKKLNARVMSLRFPLGGVDESLGFQDQRPYTTPECQNVWPTSQSDGRERGGTRPGLGKFGTNQAGSSNSVNMLGTVRFVNVAGTTIVTRMVAACNGALYYSDDGGDWAVCTGLSVTNTTTLLHCTEMLGKLYIADGAVPKVYTPISSGGGSIATLLSTTTSGTAPTGCVYVTMWNDRLVFAGNPADAHNWFMSRSGDPTDWLFTDLDVASSVAGNNADAGKLGEPVTALIPHGHDCLVFGCKNSMWSMRGDPASGGRIVNLTHEIGILDGKAWCRAADTLIYFMSHDGVYLMDQPCGSAPKSISRERLPDDLLFVSDTDNTVLMEYDPRFRGIQIYIGDNDGTTDTSYWMTLTGTFWPMEYGDTNCMPRSICRNPFAGSSDDSDVIFGGRDGYTYNLQRDLYKDNGSNFVSYIVYGPIPLSKNPLQEGSIQQISGALAGESGVAVWEIHTANTFEGAANTSENPAYSGSWSAGLNYTEYPRVGGSAFTVKITNGAFSNGWSVESIELVLRDGGRRRL